VDLGGLTLRALATPGHTGEHLSFELLDASTVLGVFTGGSLIVGGAARTDLAGPDHTEALSRSQYRSLQRLHAARRNGGLADPWRRVVLLRAARRRADVDDRP
jgi:hydroxyacylglutathione hydrolase